MNRNWSQIRQIFRRLNSDPKVRSFTSSPITKIVGVNVVVFLMWRLRLIPESFMVKNFAFDQVNIRENRYHTMITHAFSHFGIFSFAFDTLLFAMFGSALRRQYGNRIIYAIYLIAAATSGLTMALSKPVSPFVTPQVGSDVVGSAMFTFWALQNLSQKFMFFFFPVPAWGFLAFMTLYSLADPSKRTFGAIVGGVLTYQLFRFRIL